MNALTSQKLALAQKIIEEIRAGGDVMKTLRHYPLEGGAGYLTKAALVAAYQQMTEQGVIAAEPALLERIRMKPMRTLSGVTTVTVLTKPYPCPGKCIFCPTDVRMPKSYLPDEPGAMRALEHQFDPYQQVHSRILALKNLGHPTDKIELLILGGTWSAYRRDYQAWFVRRCFDAMNEDETQSQEFQSQETLESSVKALDAAHHFNETAPHRNVGLVIETRPDEITPDEIRWLRQLGVTKVQLGAQSLDDRILELNQRGHTVERTRQAAALLRAAGFKIVLHWMPNLLGATPDSDREDFARLWSGFCPDEIKIYPNQLLANAELYSYWQRGEFHPYTTDELVKLIADVKPTIPRYCRVNRVIRDIPGNNVVEGNTRTSLRQDVQSEMKQRGTHCECIRCREVRSASVSFDYLSFDDLTYSAGAAEERFLSFATEEDKLAGFLRLSLNGVESFPTFGKDMEDAPPALGIADLDGAALIREVHVYGQSLAVGEDKSGAAQHLGLGTRLLQAAEEIARARGYKKIAVIAAVGTRQYYLARGFQRGELYLTKDI
ncbi:MAG: tRNA uridine(34) 5-carboxymethylaminomethyl modification radical SAM/GNAT enzyme Elp3 [Anaerolineales bacterium]